LTGEFAPVAGAFHRAAGVYGSVAGKGWREAASVDSVPPVAHSSDFLPRNAERLAYGSACSVTVGEGGTGRASGEAPICPDWAFARNRNGRGSVRLRYP